MTSIELTGNSIDELINQFRKKHHIHDWELKYEIITEASAGFLGIGKKQACVKFYILEISDRIKMFTEQLLEHLGVTHNGIDIIVEGKTYYARINNASDPGFLIGKNGGMLQNLQYLINRVFENCKELERIYLDTEDYRQRQEYAFLRQYISIIDKVKKSRKPTTLELMNAAERRIIHKYVERDKSLRTLTIGEGEKKRIVIFPNGMSEKEAVNQPKALPREDSESLSKHSSHHERPRRDHIRTPRAVEPEKPAPDVDLELPEEPTIPRNPFIIIEPVSHPEPEPVKEPIAEAKSEVKAINPNRHYTSRRRSFVKGK